MQAVFWFVCDLEHQYRVLITSRLLPNRYAVGTSAAISSTRVFFVAVFWSLNGMGQAVAWPALARVFMDWFPDPATRGTWCVFAALEL